MRELTTKFRTAADWFSLNLISSYSPGHATSLEDLSWGRRIMKKFNEQVKLTDGILKFYDSSVPLFHL